MDNHHYILSGKEIVPCDLMTWAKWFENTENRRIGFDKVGDSEVSTVFLGLNHNFSGDGQPPILFETLVFGGPLDAEGERYSTYEEAEAGHKKWIENVSVKNEEGGK